MSPTPSEKKMAAALVFGLTSFSKPRFIRSLTGAGLIRKDYLLAMERSPIRDIAFKQILKAALTDDINRREVHASTTAATSKNIPPSGRKNCK